MYIYRSSKTNSEFLNITKKDLQALARLPEAVPAFSPETIQEIQKFCRENILNYENSQLTFELSNF